MKIQSKRSYQKSRQDIKGSNFNSQENTSKNMSYRKWKYMNAKELQFKQP